MDSNLVKSWNSYFSASDQPSSLFSGVRHRLQITLGSVGQVDRHNRLRYSTRFLKWFQDERLDLFTSKLKYVQLPTELERLFPKVSSQLETSILVKMMKFANIGCLLTETGEPIYYHDAPVHWGKVFNFIPKYEVDGRDESPSSHVKCIKVPSTDEQNVLIAMLNSSLFYWYLWQYSNCRDLTKRDIGQCPLGFNQMSHENKAKLSSLVGDLMDALLANSRPYRRVTGSIVTVFQSFYPAKSKAIIDKIDWVLAKHFGLSEVELGFIINYDLKYRMGLSTYDE
jgi:hypothetical protein